LLKRQLDTERFIDGEGDVEEIEAINLEILGGMALGLDIFTRDVARFRNNFSDFIVRRGHQPCSLSH
jgi:hypothetical protein